MSETVVLDYGAGNVRSVVRAFARLGEEAVLTRDPDRVARAARLVFPGQGALPDAMRRLRAGGLDEAIRAHVRAGRPYLGICLGLQALFDRGTEHEGAEGLGLLPGEVVRFPDAATDAAGAPLKIPHMGWNAVDLTEVGRAHPVLAAVPDGVYFYFVHSFYARPSDPALVAAESRHGVRFCVAVARENLVACQFHPEKSQEAGEALLRAWMRL